MPYCPYEGCNQDLGAVLRGRYAGDYGDQFKVRCPSCQRIVAATAEPDIKFYVTTSTAKDEDDD